MKKIVLCVLVVIVLAGVLLVLRHDDKPVLHLYNWADYMNPDVITKFETEHGCSIVVDNFDSNESMYAKLKAGAGGYDLIFPSSYMAQIMDREGMLARIDHSKIPNLKHIDPMVLDIVFDHEMAYSVPYLMTATGIGYNKEKLGDVAHSWRIYERQDLAGRMTMLNDMREAIGAALKTLGFSINTTDESQLEQARDLVIQWKKNLAKFDVDEAKRGLASGEFFVIQHYNGDMIQLMDETETVDFFLPEEGTSIASDDMVIPKDAPHPDLAHAFIDFIHRPEISAENMEYVSFQSPNIGAREFLSDEFKSNEAIFLSEDIVKKSEVVADLGEENTKYTRIWDQVRAAE